MLAFLFSSERRDSNPRPRPWQGRALPAELLSRSGRQIYSSNYYLQYCLLFFRNFFF